MKKYIIILFLLISSMTFSQIKMSGKVTDSLGTPLELANIILIDSESNTLETFAMSDNQGVYKLNLKKNNNYNLQVSYIGMATFSQTFKSGETDISKDFLLRPDNQLDAVELTYEMPVVVSGDTLVYDADSFKTGTERKLEDVLKNLPGVEVNDDGEIEVEGKAVTKIMVEVPDSHWLSMFIGFPNVQEPTKFVNTDLALALAIFLVVQYTGISSKGFVGYLRSFVDDPFPMKGFWIILFPLNIFFYLNIIGAVANVVSHSFRLFGNIFGGGMIIVIVSSLLKYMFIPIGLNAFFTIFAGLVQAFVFTMLAVTYIQQQQA